MKRGVATANLGHRLGGSSPQTDNTIATLRSTIEKVDNPKFKYWEFDVHEAADGVLFVFHDDDIESNGVMKPVKALPYEKIRECGNAMGFEISTLDEVVDVLKERPEPTMIEIKNLMTDQARQKIIDTISERSDWKLMASVTRFLKSFPKQSRHHWHSEIQKTGTELVRVREHDVDLFKISRTWLILSFNRLKWKMGF